MLNDATFIAVIPARGGSARLPRKNIVDLNGKPMIEWTIDAALSSKYVDRVIVSTDDEEIARISCQAGVDVPFCRPAELAGSDSSSIDVIVHALATLAKSQEVFDYCLLLQPTSPLRTHEHIDRAIEFLFDSNADAVIGVTPVSHPVEWIDELPSDLSMDNFCRTSSLKRSQEAPPRYTINGAIYLSKVDRLLQENRFMLAKRCFAFVMSPIVSVDIDSAWDLSAARAFMTQNTP